jgi:CRISPR-associated endonuclease/helicase Cas3
VQQAQDILSCIARAVDNVSLLHSRFIARHRADKEAALIATPNAETNGSVSNPARKYLWPRKSSKSHLMSHSIRFITEVAPVDALLQRFGRVNRLNEHEHSVRFMLPLNTR